MCLLDEHLCEMPGLPGFDPIPVLELMERELVWTGEEQAKMYQAYKGSIQAQELSCSTGCATIIIHIHD